MLKLPNVLPSAATVEASGLIAETLPASTPASCDPVAALLPANHPGRGKGRPGLKSLFGVLALSGWIGVSVSSMEIAMAGEAGIATRCVQITTKVTEESHRADHCPNERVQIVRHTFKNTCDKEIIVMTRRNIIAEYQYNTLPRRSQPRTVTSRISDEVLPAGATSKENHDLCTEAKLDGSNFSYILPGNSPEQIIACAQYAKQSDLDIDKYISTRLSNSPCYAAITKNPPDGYTDILPFAMYSIHRVHSWYDLGRTGGQWIPEKDEYVGFASDDFRFISEEYKARPLSELPAPTKDAE
ncbi:MAG: hypothetical protein OXU75_05010 [Deltaproteobacteria bacterium]|nr:hypothetical protein [Deltaproteobacteria bacterium]